MTYYFSLANKNVKDFVSSSGRCVVILTNHTGCNEHFECIFIRKNDTQTIYTIDLGSTDYSYYVTNDGNISLVKWTCNNNDSHEFAFVRLHMSDVFGGNVEEPYHYYHFAVNLKEKFRLTGGKHEPVKSIRILDILKNNGETVEFSLFDEKKMFRPDGTIYYVYSVKIPDKYIESCYLERNSFIKLSYLSANINNYDYCAAVIMYHSINGPKGLKDSIGLEERGDKIMNIKTKYFVISINNIDDYIYETFDWKKIYFNGTNESPFFPEAIISLISKDVMNGSGIYSFTTSEHHVLYNKNYAFLKPIKKVFISDTIDKPDLYINLYDSREDAEEEIKRGNRFDSDPCNIWITTPWTRNDFLSAKIFENRITNKLRKDTLIQMKPGEVTWYKKDKYPINAKFSGPATIVFWSDGSKTVVKTQNGEKFDPEKGLAMALCKGYFSGKNPTHWYNFIKENASKYEVKEEKKEASEILNNVVNKSEETPKSRKIDKDFLKECIDANFTLDEIVETTGWPKGPTACAYYKMTGTSPLKTEEPAPVASEVVKEKKKVEKSKFNSLVDAGCTVDEIADTMHLPKGVTAMLYKKYLNKKAKEENKS